MTTWRDRARPIIADVIERVGKSDLKALRKALKAAYPFGEFAYHPYKIWCDEIRFQLGTKVPPAVKARQRIEATGDGSQGKLFS